MSHGDYWSLKSTVFGSEKNGRLCGGFQGYLHVQNLLCCLVCACTPLMSGVYLPLRTLLPKKLMETLEFEAFML